MLTDEQWRQLDWENEMYRAIERAYKPPRFDPFTELNPPVSLIKNTIKQLKQQAYEYQDDIRRQKAEGYPTEGTEAGAKKVISRIKSYEYRLKGRERTGGWEHQSNPGTISPDHISSAKQVKIESLYNGTLRRAGGDLVGRCPFHNERSASFHIYTAQNRWHCFGTCSRGGDSVDFIQLRDGVDFITAVKYLIT